MNGFAQRCSRCITERSLDAAIDPVGGSFALIADTMNHAVRRVDLVDPAHPVSNVAGKQCSASDCWGNDDGVGTAAKFKKPYGIAIDPVRAEYALIADNFGHKIRKVVLATRNVTILAGSGSYSYLVDGIGSVTRFTHPTGIAIHRSGRYAVVTDKQNHALRRVDLHAFEESNPTYSNSVTTLAVGGVCVEGRRVATKRFCESTVDNPANHPGLDCTAGNGGTLQDCENCVNGNAACSSGWFSWQPDNPEHKCKCTDLDCSGSSKQKAGQPVGGYYNIYKSAGRGSNGDPAVYEVAISKYPS